MENTYRKWLAVASLTRLYEDRATFRTVVEAESRDLAACAVGQILAREFTEKNWRLSALILTDQGEAPVVLMASPTT